MHWQEQSGYMLVQQSLPAGLCRTLLCQPTFLCPKKGGRLSAAEQGWAHEWQQRRRAMLHTDTRSCSGFPRDLSQFGGLILATLMSLMFTSVTHLLWCADCVEADYIKPHTDPWVGLIISNLDNVFFYVTKLVKLALAMTQCSHTVDWMCLAN